MALFERSEEIFEDENVLHEDYQPQSLEERDEELEQYKGYLQPVINGAQPRNIFLYGKTGVGKTATTSNSGKSSIPELRTHFVNVKSTFHHTMLLNSKISFPDDPN